MMLILFVPMPVSMPFYLFGHVFTGAAPRIIMGASGLVLGIAAVAILKLKPWGLHTALTVQSIFFVNGVFAIASPNYRTYMHDALDKMSTQYAAFPEGNPFLSDTYITSMMIFGLVFGIGMIALMLHQRSRFLKQAAASAAKT